MRVMVVRGVVDCGNRTERVAVIPLSEAGYFECDKWWIALPDRAGDLDVTHVLNAKGTRESVASSHGLGTPQWRKAPTNQDEWAVMIACLMEG